MKEEIKKCLSGVVGWRQHYDTEDLELLDEDLMKTESGKFYQELHPALRLDIINSAIPENRDLEEYLREVEEGAINSVVQDIKIKKSITGAGRELVANDVIYNSMGWVNDVIINEGRFVGIRFILNHEIGLKAVINRFALQLTQAQDVGDGLKIYLFHNHKAEALATFNHKTVKGGQFNWQEIQQELTADEQDLTGGMYYLGYYQDELKGQAVSYKKLNWSTGFCGGCDGGVNQTRYTSITKHVQMTPFYVPSSSLAIDKSKMFDPFAVIETPDNNWGFNFNISVHCDLSTFWCDNRFILQELIGYEVTLRILKMMQFSTELNHLEEQMKLYIIRDIEGDRATNYVHIPKRYERALKDAVLNTSNISKVCLPCVKKKGGGLHYTVN